MMDKGKGKTLRYRWSNEGDRHWGPFTWCTQSTYKPLGLMLKSGQGEDSDDYGYSWTGPVLMLGLPWATFFCALPRWVLRPWGQFTSTAGAVYHTVNGPTEPRPPGSGFWEYFPREIGFTLANAGDDKYDYLSLHYGPQTHDSSTTKSKGYFLPWHQWTHIRKSYYDAHGRHFYTEPHPYPKWKDREACDEVREKAKATPVRCFAFLDFDNEHNTVRTTLVEHEWSKGEKWCSWLRWFVPNKVRRSLDLRFIKQVGSRKGSWKGGTLGHAIETVSPSESHAEAFKRYCLEHNMTFLFEVDPAEVSSNG